MRRWPHHLPQPEGLTPPAQLRLRRKRQVVGWLARLNLTATLLLLGALFIFVNFIASRRYVRADLTKTKITALSEKTTQVLAQLREPLTVTVFYQPGHRLYPLVRDLLTEYQERRPSLRVEYVDPEQDIARAKQLAQEFEIDRVNLVVFQAGARHKYLSDTDLAEYDYSRMALGGQPSVSAFKGEEAFTSAMLAVTQTSQPLVWVSTGHGEKSLEEPGPEGLSALKKFLERDNIKVEPAVLLEHADIPASVGAVVIAGPTRGLLEQEVARLRAYVDGGGRLLVLADPMQETGLEAFLKEWGVELGNNIVVDPARQLPFISAANLFVTTYTQHPIVEKMQTLMTLYPLTRSVRPADDVKDGLTVTPLALTSPQGWGETETQASEFQYAEGTDMAGPVSIAAAVEQAGEGKARLVIIGDSDFAANGQIENVGNQDLILGACHWLMAQEQLIGIGPKPLESIRLTLTAGQVRGIFWLSFAGFPALMGLLGAGVWWRRRR